jgi:cytidylate kinase
MSWGSAVTIDPGVPLVVEGCGSINRYSAPLAAFSYWLDADSEVRQKRAIDRDGDVFAKHWVRWARQEERFFAIHQSRDLANQVVWT